MMDPDQQSQEPDLELESPDIPKRVEIRLRSRIQGRNRNTSSRGGVKYSDHIHIHTGDENIILIVGTSI